MSASVEFSPLFDATLQRVELPTPGQTPTGAPRREPAAGAPTVARPEPPGGEVAARVRAFGTNGDDPRTVTR